LLNIIRFNNLPHSKRNVCKTYFVPTPGGAYKPHLKVLLDSGGAYKPHLKVLLDSGGAYKPHTLKVNLLIRLTTIGHFKY